MGEGSRRGVIYIDGLGDILDLKQPVVVKSPKQAELPMDHILAQCVLSPSLFLSLSLSLSPPLPLYLLPQLRESALITGHTHVLCIPKIDMLLSSQVLIGANWNVQKLAKRIRIVSMEAMPGNTKVPLICCDGYDSLLTKATRY